MSVYETVSAHSLLGKAPAEARLRLARRSTLKSFAAGARVVRALAPQTHVLLVISGALALYRSNRKEGSEIHLGLLEANAVFGDAELYADTPTWMASASAVGATRVLFMANEGFEAISRSSIEVAHALYRDACARHMNAVQIIQVLGLEPVGKSMLALLWSLAHRQEPNHGPPVVPLSQVQLSRALGVNPRTVARNLLDLEQRGFIRRAPAGVALLMGRESSLEAPLQPRGLGASWRLPANST